MKRYRIRITGYFFLMVMLLSACGSKGGDTDIREKFLVGSVMLKDSSVVNTFRPFLFQDKLITDRFDGDYRMSVENISGDTINHLVDFLRQGNGPGEFMMVDLFKGQGSIVYAFNEYGGFPISLTKIDVSDLSDRNSGNNWVSYPLDKLEGLRTTSFSGIELTDSTLLINSAGYGSESMFSILDFKNQRFDELKWMPDDGRNMEAILKQGVYIDNSMLFSSGDRYFYICGEGRFAFIFTINGTGLDIQHIILDEYPEYEAMPDGINYMVIRRKPQATAYATSSYIYILDLETDIHGKIPKENYPREYGSKLHVFNWEGKAVADYSLDHPGRRIMVSDDDEYLYIVGFDNDSLDESIIRYRLDHL